MASTTVKLELLHFAPPDNNEVFKTSVKRQWASAITMDLLAFSYGATCGWPSAAIPILKTDDTPMESYGPITSSDASWIASSICIGGFFGNLLIGWLSTKIGQKMSLCIVAIPQIFSWVLIYYAENPFNLIASRLMSGFAGGGLYSIIPSYISEISDDRIRGTLGSTVVFASNLGMFFAYICGEYADFLTVPWLMLPPSLLFLIFFAKVPNSPTFLAKKNLYEEAEKSLLYFKSIRNHSKYSKQLINENLQKLDFGSRDDENELSVDDFKARHARKAVVYGIILMALNQFCGIFAMLNFTATIFQQSGSTLSPNVSSIIIAGIQIVGSLLPTLLVDKLGRKMLMGTSAFGTSLGLTVLGVYTLLKSEGINVESCNWIPLLAFSFVILIANLGLMTLPFMIVSELSHPKIRGFVTILCMSCLWIFAFIAVKYLPLLIDVMGMHGTMFLFALNSLVGALFIKFFLPETNGKSFNEIVDFLER